MAKGILGNTEGSLNIVWGVCVLVFWKFFLEGRGICLAFVLLGVWVFFVCLFSYTHWKQTYFIF